MKRKLCETIKQLENLSLKKQKQKQPDSIYKNIFNSKTKDILVKQSFSLDEVCNILNQHDDELNQMYYNLLELQKDTIYEIDHQVKVK